MNKIKVQSLKSKVILIGILVFISISGYYLFIRNLNPVSVKTIALNRGDLKVTVTATATGTVKAEDEEKISAQRTGRIIKLNFEEGDAIKKGDIIAELDSREAGVHVKQIEAVFRSSEARVTHAKANLDDAERTLKRMKTLYKDGLISAEALDSAQKNYDVNLSLYESSLANLKEMKASLDTARIQFEYSFIKAPMTGIISQRPVVLGETVSIGSHIATIIKPERIYVKASIDEVDAGHVSVSQQVTITIDAFPGKVFNGKVTRVSPIVLGVKQETRTFEVRIGFDVEEKGIKPGMSADIEIITDTLKGVLYLPAHTVVERKGKKMVYIVEGKKARLVPVEIGLSTWNYIEVKKGLKEGDRIITNPDAPGLEDGVRVKIEDKG
jgi:RND family efflux transporter MFP subunit